MGLQKSHFSLSVSRMAALALLLTASPAISAPPEVPDLAQATNDLRVLLETAQTAWAYADDKAEYFDVKFPRLLRDGTAAIAKCRTRREVLEVFDETVAGFKDGHASLRHPDLYDNVPRRSLPDRLVDTREGVLLGTNLVLAWNDQPMEEQIQAASRRVYASTPGQRRSLTLKSMEKDVANHSVRLRLKQPGGLIVETNFVFNRTRPAEPFAVFRWLTNDIAYIRFTSFRAEAAAPELGNDGPKDPSGHSVAAVEAAKAKIDAAFSQASNARVLVLDLRGNAGGTDSLGSYVALHLIPGRFNYFGLQTRFSPQLQALREFRNDPTNGWSQVFQWSPERPASVTPFRGSVFILQDQRCFSTTDNLLACLQDLLPGDRVRFIGRPSGGGTGAPRAVATLPWSGATVTLTVMKVYSPKGRLIEGRGTIPDRPVEWTWDDVLNNRDADLDVALNEARGK